MFDKFISVLLPLSLLIVIVVGSLASLIQRAWQIFSASSPGLTRQKLLKMTPEEVIERCHLRKLSPVGQKLWLDEMRLPAITAAEIMCILRPSVSREEIFRQQGLKLVSPECVF